MAVTNHGSVLSAVLLGTLGLVGGCDRTQPDRTMNSAAESYVSLVLALGQHDPGYVDAYYGPERWARDAENNPGTLVGIRTQANDLLAMLNDNPPFGDDELRRLRHGYLTRQLEALMARLDMLEGQDMSFDEESQALYDAVAPTNSEAHFQSILSQIDRALPRSRRPLHDRYTRFRQDFVIAPEKLDTVFNAAIAACRERTARFIELPEEESFTLEYVTDKPWSGYNWYQGDRKSLIQVNTDLPIYIDRAIDLACHEGYPGHHVYNAMLEEHLVRERDWMEYSVYPLYSPQSLIAEGSANYGIEMAFPGEERVAFERDVLFPLAGIDPAKAERYYRVQALVDQLGYAGNEAARRYLNGDIDAQEAARWLSRYALMSPARAEQRVRFIDTYRSYVINYNLGLDLVREYIERTAGPDATEEERWAVFSGLLSSPRLPSNLTTE